MKNTRIRGNRSAGAGLVICCCILAANTGFASAAFTFQGLGDLPGGSFYSYAYDITPDGSVVVGESTSASGNYEAFRWTKAGGMVGLGDLSGGSFGSHGLGVSADGSIIVGQGTSASGLEAFRWTSAGGMVGLGDLPGGNFGSYARGVSADGTVVAGSGSVSTPNGLSTQAYRWTNTEGMVGLNGPLGVTMFRSDAVSASSDGSVIVGNSLSLPNGSQAFRWSAADGMVFIPGVAGPGHDSHPYGISADGSAIVGYSDISPNTHVSQLEAFRWTSAGGTVGLGDLPGGAFSSVAGGISDDGSVVVGYGTSDSGLEAFRWTSGGGMEKVRDILIAGGATGLTGWTLRSAYGVSADGQTIIGDGLNPQGQTEAWIATVPEPSTLVLAAFVALWLCIFVRRRQLAVRLSR